MGESLDSRLDMRIDTLREIISAANVWQTKQIALLGGEPTNHPQFSEAVAAVQAAGFGARVVTNGQKAYARYLKSFADDLFPFVCFSIDGSSPAVHDSIRGEGAFDALVESMIETQRRAFDFAAIVSVNTSNASDLSSTLTRCAALGAKYVNIHHVTNRGFATQELVPTVSEWREVTETAERLAVELALPIRLERTFSLPAEGATRCSVRENSNLMFLPDGRVHSCMLFIDVSNAHSYTWSASGLIPNQSHDSEVNRVRSFHSYGCPAQRLVNAPLARSAERAGLVGHCIYDKRELGPRAESGNFAHNS